MPKRTNEFQRLIYFIQHELSDEANVSESEILKNIRTGSTVEVDIVIEADTGGIPIIVCVECTTSSSRKATVEWVREMYGKHQDLTTNKLVLVSGSGFSKEAKAVANAHGIETLNFKDAEKFDWSGTLSILIENSNLEIANMKIKVSSWSLKFHSSEEEKLKLSNDISFSENSKIFISSGELLGTIQQLGNSMIRDQQNVERIIDQWINNKKTEYKITWNAHDDTQVTDLRGNKYLLQSLILYGRCEVETTPVKFSKAMYGETQVAYGKVPDIFSGSSGEVTVFFAEREGEEALGGLGFTSDSGFGKSVFPLQKSKTSFGNSND